MFCSFLNRSLAQRHLAVHRPACSHLVVIRRRCGVGGGGLTSEYQSTLFGCFVGRKKRAKLKERKLLCVSLSGLSPSVSNKQTLLLYTLVYIIVLCCFIHEQIERLKKCIYSYHSDISGGWNFFSNCFTVGKDRILN